MKKIFKSVDEKLADIGFVKLKDDRFVVFYERHNCHPGGYTQCLDIMHKNSGRHIVSSYDKDLFDEKQIGNCAVGLTYYEMKLILKKMKEKGWISK